MARLQAVELFAGAGGLALGVAQAGFGHVLLLDSNPTACRTLRANAGLLRASPTAVAEGDVRQRDYSGLGEVALVVGGPPCQPFSIGGKHSGRADKRDMFPEAVRAVRELRPMAFIFENVKGLLRDSFSDYFSYVLLQLQSPDDSLRRDETWEDHYARLRSRAGRTIDGAAAYDVTHALLNAADFGVPQRRERVLIVGTRRDLRVQWRFPQPTHSRAALQYAKWTTGEYWARHGLEPPTRDIPRGASQLRLRPGEKAWRTVRDALGHLPPPAPEGDGDHVLVPGARAYKGHTGSPWDEPAKTLKAGDHGVPGGENTLAAGAGAVRYFTVLECSLLQTFPPEFRFEGAWTEKMRQIGNAVPPQLGFVVAATLRQKLEDSRQVLRGAAGLL